MDLKNEKRFKSIVYRTRDLFRRGKITTAMNLNMFYLIFNCALNFELQMTGLPILHLMGKIILFFRSLLITKIRKTIYM